MNFRTAIDQTFKSFGLKGSEIAEISGISATQISNYRRGKKDLYAENLQSIIDSLPIEAKTYFYVLLLEQAALNNKPLGANARGAALLTAS